MASASKTMVLHTAAVAPAPGRVFRGDGFGRVVLQITGLTNGTVTFEASVDGTTFVGILGAPPSTGKRQRL